MSNFSDMLNSGADFPYIVKSANYTAKEGEGILVDTSGGGFTITLPSTPVGTKTGQKIRIVDITRSFALNNLTVAVPVGSTATIQGTVSPLIVNTDGAWFDLIYYADSDDWFILAPFIGNAQGIVPLGGVVPVISSLAGSFTPPATGEVKDGWMLCDGGAIPAGQKITATSTPLLNDSRFLMGSTVAGNTGGTINNLQTLAEANLPSHTHSTPNHTHPVPAHTHNSSSISGTVGGSDGGHTHGMTNSILRSTAAGGGTGRYPSGASTTSSTLFGDMTLSVNSTGSGHGHGHSLTAAGQGGGATTASSAGASTSGSTGSGTAFSVLPQYLSCVYMVRVN